MTPVAATTSKGSATREMIIERAFDIASKRGLEGLSIGTLSAAAGMSKSGVFAHFGSREDLQLSVLDWTAERFGDAVVRPALSQPRGLRRLRAILANWLAWIGNHPDGCLMLASAIEYDARPGPLRDRVVQWLGEWQRQVAKAIGHCVEARELPPDTDIPLLAFQLLGLADALQNARLYDPHNASDLARRTLDQLLPPPHPN